MSGRREQPLEREGRGPEDAIEIAVLDARDDSGALLPSAVGTPVRSAIATAMHTSVSRFGDPLSSRVDAPPRKA